MKRLHLILLVTAIITALASVYSLAAINQVYTIGYEWFSTYTKLYVNEVRVSDKYVWQLDKLPESLEIGVTTAGFVGISVEEKAKDSIMIDWDKYIAIWCTLGEVGSPEYSVRIADIAQRGDVVEVKICLNSPVKIWQKPPELATKYLPFDMIRFPKSALSTKGKLFFIFKDQSGNQLYSKYVFVY